MWTLFVNMIIVDKSGKSGHIAEAEAEAEGYGEIHEPLDTHPLIHCSVGILQQQTIPSTQYPASVSTARTWELMARVKKGESPNLSQAFSPH